MPFFSSSGSLKSFRPFLTRVFMLPFLNMLFRMSLLLLFGIEPVTSESLLLLDDIGCSMPIKHVHFSPDFTLRLGNRVILVPRLLMSAVSLNQLLFVDQLGRGSANSRIHLPELHLPQISLDVGPWPPGPDSVHKLILGPRMLFTRINHELFIIREKHQSRNRLKSFYKDIMLEYLGTAFLVVAFLIWYMFVERPRKLWKFYVRSFSAMGFKVMEVPIDPLGTPFFDNTLKDNEQGDPFKKSKNECVGFDVMVSNSFNRIILILIHPDLIKDYVANEGLFCYEKMKQLSVLIDRGLGKGVFLSQGKVWKSKRKIISQVFTFEFMLSMKGKISRIIQSSFQSHEKLSSDSHPNMDASTYRVNLKKLCEESMGNIMVDCFLGGGSSETEIQGKKVGEYFCDYQSDVTLQSLQPISLALGLKFLNLGLRAEDRKINHQTEVLQTWGLNFVKKRVKQEQQAILNKTTCPESDNIVRRFVQHRMQSKDINDSYNDEQLFEEFKTFFVSGTDTTNKFIQMMIYYLGKHPECQKKVRQQIQEHMTGSDTDYEALKRLKYLQAVQKQTTRLFGPANFSALKETVKDHHLCGVPVKKGTILMHMSMPNHYSEKYFKNPTEFRPERWLTGELDNLHPYAHYGFHAGARSCIGKNLALLQSKIFLVKFLKRYSGLSVPEQINMKLLFIYSPEEMEITLTKFIK